VETLEVIIPYHDREENLAKLVESIKKVDNTKITFAVANLIPVEHFNTGKAFNIGAQKSYSKWIMKNDVDCIATPDLYMEAWEKIQDMDEKDYLIFGAKYLDENGNPSEQEECGNEFVCSKQAWQDIGGVPEWTGYGWEDYAFELELEKNRNPLLRVPYFPTPAALANWIKENIVIPKNKDNKHWFNHHWHKREINIMQRNKNYDNLHKMVYRND
jgi:glycosyltransferase involved in cell wall biosynthesis